MGDKRVEEKHGRTTTEAETETKTERQKKRRKEASKSNLERGMSKEVDKSIPVVTSKQTISIVIWLL